MKAQTDFGTWTNIQANKVWKGGAYAFTRLEHRSFNNARSTECMFIAAGGGYRFTNWLTADLSYEFWDIQRMLNYHKAVLCATATKNEGDWSFMLKEKYELALNPASGDLSHTLRTRVRAKYTVPSPNSLKVSPYLMFEMFNDLGRMTWIRDLHYAGCELSFNRHHSLDLYYMFHLWDKASTTPYIIYSSCNIAGIGYFFTF
jgi:Protein of unknown function (DUF2490).